MAQVRPFVIERQLSDDGSGAFSSIFKPVPTPKRAGSVVDRDGVEKDEEKENLERFEQWRAKASATTLEVGAAMIFVGSSFYHAESPKDWLSSLAWHVSLWLVPHGFAHRPKTTLNTLGFLAGVGTLFIQPHMDICRRVSYVGAVHGAASVMTLIRSFQFWMNQSEFKDWKPWRRMFFISAWGWHDIREAKFIGDEEAATKLQSELRRLAKWFTLMVATVLFHFWWGKVPEGLSLGEAFRKVFVQGDRQLLKFLLVRWGVGYWTLLAWFYSMDAFPRALHYWADQHELRRISEDPFEAVTLKDFWGRRWNVPVQDMLVKGVYLPISRQKWLPLRKTIAKLMVFIASGAGHTYAISCGGSPWGHLAAMFSFFMVQIPLIAIEDLFSMKGIAWMMLSETPFAPLFIEPCLHFVHL